MENVSNWSGLYHQEKFLGQLSYFTKYSYLVFTGS